MRKTKNQKIVVVAEEEYSFQLRIGRSFDLGPSNLSLSNK
jgi:hypothetical protein